LIRDQETIAATVGIPVTTYKLAAFTFSSAVIGVEGSLLAHFTGAVSTETYTFVIAVQYLAMIFIGGLDSIAGAVIGAAIVTALPAVIPNIVSAIVGSQEAAIHGPHVALIAYGLLIIIFITRAPRGIAGWLQTTWRWVAGFVSRRFAAYQSTAPLNVPSG
jgi:branched-chain amino acid transport system permease protein